MLRRTMFLRLKEDVSTQAVAAFEQAIKAAPHQIPPLLHARLGRNLAPLVPRSQAWDYLFDCAFADSAALAQYNAHSYHQEALLPYFRAGPQQLVERFELVHYRTLRSALPEPELRDCIRRTLVMSVPAETPVEKVLLFEKQIMEMPRHIPAITNWAVSRADNVVQPTRWTHVWELELRREEDFQQYMESPFHWGLVDRWFNAEWPQHIVDYPILHGYYRSPESILAWA